MFVELVLDPATKPISAVPNVDVPVLVLILNEHPPPGLTDAIDNLPVDGDAPAAMINFVSSTA